MYIFIVIIIFIIIDGVIIFLQNLGNNNNNEKNEEIISSIQLFLFNENKKKRFSSNEIHITGKFDTNFKVTVICYLEYQGKVTDEKILEKINGIFTNEEIKNEDLTFIHHIMFDE